MFGKKVRFFHIDGGHGYEHVIGDSNTALQVVGQRSIITLDHFMQIDNPEVTETIFDTFRCAPRNFVHFAMTNKKLYMCNCGDREIYLRYLLALMPGAITRKRKLWGMAVLVLKPSAFALDRQLELAKSPAAADQESTAWHDAIVRASMSLPTIDAWLSETTSLNDPA